MPEISAETARPIRERVETLSTFEISRHDDFATLDFELEALVSDLAKADLGVDLDRETSVRGALEKLQVIGLDENAAANADAIVELLDYADYNTGTWDVEGIDGEILEQLGELAKHLKNWLDRITAE